MHAPRGPNFGIGSVCENHVCSMEVKRQTFPSESRYIFFMKYRVIETAKRRKKHYTPVAQQMQTPDSRTQQEVYVHTLKGREPEASCCSILSWLISQTTVPLTGHLNSENDPHGDDPESPWTEQRQAWWPLPVITDRHVGSLRGRANGLGNA